ncbi:MFS transporter [Candidatus Tisiphia endosymbiont of Oplodontha viridula]|uniref:MFS transporter n=1 Tax=Candidatus Tisiphia endosymbiont of Oplodontha viridula TaxID=3077925 RepID=UPI0035C8AF40
MPEYVRYDEGTFSSLTKQQKEAIGLLAIGTFLEYFDLMLYVHMAVLLNELFFPKAAPHTQAIYSACAFCSTFVFRPLGAFIFGWIGDNIGRKVTVVITTLMMGISCFVMAIIPSYDQIGFTATVIVTLCRIIQGISSMGEVVGAKIYLTEFTKPPVRYPIVSSMTVSSNLGTTCALGFVSLVLAFSINWRYIFLVGTIIAIVSTVARTRLRETPEFDDAKRYVKKVYNIISIDNNTLTDNYIYNEKLNKCTCVAYFLMECLPPIWFYLTFIYCGNVLKTSFNFTAIQIIHQNFIVSIIDLLAVVLWTYLSYNIYPLKILKMQIIIFGVFICLFPLIISSISTAFQLLIIQGFMVTFAFGTLPASAIFFKKFSIFKRFTCASLTFAISRAVMYLITSFGFIYCTKFFNHTGLLIIIIPAVLGYLWGFYHFHTSEERS